MGRNPPIDQPLALFALALLAIQFVEAVQVDQLEDLLREEGSYEIRLRGPKGEVRVVDIFMFGVDSIQYCWAAKSIRTLVRHSELWSGSCYSGSVEEFE